MLKNKYIELSLALLLQVTVHNTIQARAIGSVRGSQQAPIQQPAQVLPAQQAPQPQVQPRPAQVPSIQPTVQIQPIPAQPRLADFDFGSASVLPCFTENNIQYCILSREVAGRDAGTYDDFGGKRDPGESAVVAAAREFSEEAMLEYTIGFSLQNTQNLIDTTATNTAFVIASSGQDWKNVTYITDFTQYANKFFSQFYKARNIISDPNLTPGLTRKSRYALLEKDMVAIVRLDDLKRIITQNTSNVGVTVNAHVLTPQGLQVGQIQLRGFFVKKLRPFFMDQPYQQGADKKVRFYGAAPAVETRQQCLQRCQQQCP